MGLIALNCPLCNSTVIEIDAGEGGNSLAQPIILIGRCKNRRRCKQRPRLVWQITHTGAVARVRLDSLSVAGIPSEQLRAASARPHSARSESGCFVSSAEETHRG